VLAAKLGDDRHSISREGQDVLRSPLQLGYCSFV
jgi:hypothetical protein